MEKKDLKPLNDILLDFLSESMPYDEVKKINQTITEGRDYVENLKELERRIKSDPSLRKQLILRRDIKTALSEPTDILKLRQQLDDIHNNRKVKFMKSKKMYWVAAALLALLFAWGIVLRTGAPTYTHDSIYSDYHNPFDGKRTALKSESEIIKTAKDKYNDKKYEEALELLKNLPGSINIAPERLFYSGLASIELGEFMTAISKLQGLINDYPETTLANYAHWYLAMVYIKTGQTGLADKTLQKIIDYKYLNHEKAEKVIKKLQLVALP